MVERFMLIAVGIGAIWLVATHEQAQKPAPEATQFVHQATRCFGTGDAVYTLAAGTPVNFANAVDRGYSTRLVIPFGGPQVCEISTDRLSEVAQ
jgi:hypothetical protein